MDTGLAKCSNVLPPLAALTTPTLTWNEGAPHSTAFDDVYFTRGDGRAETEHVFLGANHLPERFAAWQARRPFVIGETGFGTGLNMLCAWACFEQHAHANARLHLLSTEKFPLEHGALEQALASWPSLARYAKALCDQWPAAISGIHRLHLTERVILDLHFGDTTERLTQLDGQVDAWFLDGFAPSKNPEMWQPDLFNAMAARSRPGATFATFTCAGIVKRGLKAAGFSWQKVPGYGRKREMLAGSIESPPTDQRRHSSPWFMPPLVPTAKLSGRPHVAIVGAGLAGSTLAAALARRGIQVTVIEREAPGAGGSGNRQGALYVKLAAETNHQSRVYLAGLLYSQRWLTRHAPQALWQPCGVVQLASSDKEARRQQRFMDNHPLPSEVVTALENPALTATASVKTTSPSGLFYSQAGWVRPKALCEHLLSQPGIRLRQGDVASLATSAAGSWRLHMTDGSTLDADQVVVASAHLANQFTQTAELPLQSVRGQVSELTLPDSVQGPKRVVCAGGYVAPALEGVLTFGASFVPNNATTDVTTDDHQRNINELRQMLPTLAEQLAQAGVELSPENLEGRAAVRAASPDKSPYAGPVPVAEAWRADYALLSKDATRVPETPGKHHPGLWISTAHGSRGLASAPLCAEVIASRICDEPMPLEAPLVDHLHPGRRLISSIIRA